MWTVRLSAAEIFFSRSGRKLSTLMNSGTAITMRRRTPTTIPEITSKRFMEKCYQKPLISMLLTWQVVCLSIPVYEDRRDRKTKTLPRINTDKRGSDVDRVIAVIGK